MILLNYSAWIRNIRIKEDVRRNENGVQGQRKDHRQEKTKIKNSLIGSHKKRQSLTTGRFFYACKKCPWGAPVRSALGVRL